jgi:phosphoribosylformylglycinamidine synthase
MSVIPDVRRSVTMDLKGRGNHLWIVGTTRNELGGSHYLMLAGELGANVPRVRPEEAVAVFRCVEKAIAAGLVLSCHDLSEGGLAVAAAEMAFAGGLGVGMDLSLVPTADGTTRDDALLFSESQSRFLVEVAPEHEAEFTALAADVPSARLGDVNQTLRLLVKGVDGDIVVDEPNEDLREAFLAPFRW